MPLTFSIITVCLNAVDTISDCIRSVQAQGVPVEHIVVDGGSTDGTLEMVREFDTVSCVLSGPDRGIFDAMNKGIGLASGDVVGILNADDLYHGPDVLLRVQNLFERQSVAACYGDLIYIAKENKGSRFTVHGLRGGPLDSINGDLKVVRYWKAGEFDRRKFFWGWMPPHPTFFVRRSVYEKHGLFNLDFGTAADYELMLRFLVKHRVTAAYLPEIIVRMRSGGVSNVSLRNRLNANQMDRMAWDVNGLKPYPWTRWLKPLRKVGQCLVWRLDK